MRGKKNKPASKRFLKALAIAREEDREKSKRKKVGKTLLYKYEVTIVREIEYRAVIEVEAESEDVAKQMAETIADNGNSSNHWIEGDTISSTVKARKL